MPVRPLYWKRDGVSMSGTRGIGQNELQLAGMTQKRPELAGIGSGARKAYRMVRSNSVVCRDPEHGLDSRRFNPERKPDMIIPTEPIGNIPRRGWRARCRRESGLNDEPCVVLVPAGR